MEVKKIPNASFLNSQVKFNVSESKEDSIIIEGFANKAIIDRGMDIIPGKAWDVSNFKKNPSLLFQHGRDTRIGNMPIGNVTDIKISDDGLYVKAEVIPTDNPDFKYLGKLIRKGILRTFSVGFNPIQADVNREGVRVIDKAELLEVSVVNVPMNQDSTFSVMSKDFFSNVDNTKAYIDHVSSKGAWVAAAIHDAIYELQSSEDDFDRDEALSIVAHNADVDLDVIKQVLSGDITPVPEPILDSFSEVLDIDRDELIDLNRSDEDVSKNSGESSDDSEMGEDNENENTDENEKPNGNEEETPKNEKGSRLGQFIKERASELKITNDSLAERMGISISAISQLLSGRIRRPRKSRLKTLAKILGVPLETLQTYINEDRSTPKNEKAEGAELQDCVRNKIPKFIDEGMERDQAVAAAFAYCKEKGSCSLTPELEVWAKETADKYIQEKQSVNPPADPTNFGSPQMEAMKQTNVMLGQLIAETQKTNMLVEKLIIEVAGRDLVNDSEEQPPVNTEKPDENLSQTSQENSSEDNAKQKQILDTIANYKEHINQKLKNCGIN